MRFPAKVHQIALVAAGRRQELYRTLIPYKLKDERELKYTVSHRCHNKHCFNEKHLIVEPLGDNLVSSYTRFDFEQQ